MSESDGRTKCLEFLHSMHRGKEFKVGKHKFVVENNYSGTVYITKGKGKKLYTFKVVSITPCTIEVVEVWPGSGEPKAGVDPVAKFQL